jgi:hypothetical protein
MRRNSFVISMMHKNVGEGPGPRPARGLTRPEAGPEHPSANPDQANTAQYVARPPLKSKTAPVVYEFSADTSHATIAAISSTSTKRPRGILLSM